MMRNGHHPHRTCVLGGKRTLQRIAFAQLALGLLLIGTLAAASIFDIRGNGSPSEPLGIYRLTHEPLTRGAFVVLKLPLKQIAALPGDAVRVTPEGSYVNGKLWPHSGIPASAPNHFPFGTYLLHPGLSLIDRRRPCGDSDFARRVARQPGALAHERRNRQRSGLDHGG